MPTKTDKGMVVVTGGAGYVGSHIGVTLLEAGFDVFIVDDLSNAHPDVVDRISTIAGRSPSIEVCDVRDADRVGRIVSAVQPTAIVHCAGLKSVSESVSDPARYFDVNVGGALSVGRAWVESSCPTLIFSSSCTVYGNGRSPLTESSVLAPASPYGWSKMVAERVFSEIAGSRPDKAVVNLRYFNPVGAHESGLIGDAPPGPPTNLMPLIARTGAEPDGPPLTIFGDDYPTPDGTAIRDYVHVVDIAEAHVLAIDHVQRSGASVDLNLGRGAGISVLELVDAFEATVGVPIRRRIRERRHGDVATAWCDPSRASLELGWTAKRGLEEVCLDAWRFETANR